MTLKLDRRELAQFRLGAHDLEIERGHCGLKPLPIEGRLHKSCHGRRIQAVQERRNEVKIGPTI